MLPAASGLCDAEARAALPWVASPGTDKAAPHSSGKSVVLAVCRATPEEIAILGCTSQRRGPRIGCFTCWDKCFPLSLGTISRRASREAEDSLCS